MLVRLLAITEDILMVILKDLKKDITPDMI